MVRSASDSGKKTTWWNAPSGLGQQEVNGGIPAPGDVNSGISLRAAITGMFCMAASSVMSCSIAGRWWGFMTEGYVELHSASAFSFLEGASQPEGLITRAAELEMPAMALLDRNGVYGAARFHTSAKRNGVRAHIGAEIAVSDLGLRLTPPDWLPHQYLKEPCRVSLICESRTGYQNLCRLTTRIKLREPKKGQGSAH